MHDRVITRDQRLGGQMAPQHILDFYVQLGLMTSAGGYAPLFDKLPREAAGLASVVQGLLLHQHWAPAYGVTLDYQRRSGSQIRRLEQMLECLLAQDDRPLTAARPVDKRLVGVCRHFTVLLAGMLRAQGVPARARCGFGAYFNSGRFEDHWVCEYWNGTKECWVLVDAQLDALQQAKLKVDFDVQDVPRDRFVIAGDAWARCRAGDADPSAFGIFDMRGLWFIAGNLMRDFSALNNMEMLPWDVWGAMILPGEPLQTDRLALFDRLAILTRAPDAAFTELRRLYEGDDRLRVPGTVFNALLKRPEAV
jgi:hypothetical protein